MRVRPASLVAFCTWSGLVMAQTPPGAAPSAAALLEVAEDAIDADPAAARSACRTLLERFPGSAEAGEARVGLLPTAILLDSGLGALRSYLDEIEAADASADRAFLRVWRGDGYAFEGDLESARSRYRLAVDELEAQDPAGGPRRRLLVEARLRLSLVGQPAPELQAGEWLGGEPRTLESVRGKLVVLDFWATWCPPCRVAMPRLDRLHREFWARGLEVWGVTMPYDYGYLPASPDQILTGGKGVQGMDEAAYRDHVERFRENTGIRYPFVIATEADHQRYLVDNRPTMVVVDERGRVQFASFGYEAERMVRGLVQHRLARD